MDFLDPRKRRARRIRLLISYFVMSAAVLVGTTVLVYSAYGYSFNTKSGDITQNGLLFVDSKPSGAQIYLNGKILNQASGARLNLPNGSYNLRLAKAGYNDWQRPFVLKPHSIVRFVYPLLLPKTPVVSSLQVYGAPPGLISQSPDHHWLVVQPPPASAALSLDIYDATALDQPKQVLGFPTGLFTNLAGGGLREVEWSSDNRHLLVAHDTGRSSEFVLLDRISPADSVNLNDFFGVAPSQVALRDKKFNQFYLFDQTAQTIRTANLNDRSPGGVLISHALSFKSYGPDLITYATDRNEPAGKTMIKLANRGKSYNLMEVARAPVYLMDAAQFQGHWYYAIGSSAQSRLNIYKDPLNNLANQAIARAVPLLYLELASPQSVSFSTNDRFIGAQGAAGFATYDIETDSKYSYSLQLPLSGPLSWLDGHRYVGLSQGNILVVDYDGTNPQLVGASLLNTGGYLDPGSSHLFAPTSRDGSTVELQSIDLRAGPDLPH